MKYIMIALLMFCFVQSALAVTPIAKIDTLQTYYDGKTFFCKEFHATWTVQVYSDSVDTLVLPGAARYVYISAGDTLTDTVFVSVNQAGTTTSSFPIFVRGTLPQTFDYSSKFIRQIFIKSSSRFRATVMCW